MSLTQVPDKALPSWQVKSNRSGIPLVEGLHESKFLKMLRMLVPFCECNISVYVQVSRVAFSISFVLPAVFHKDVVIQEKPPPLFLM